MDTFVPIPHWTVYPNLQSIAGKTAIQDHRNHSYEIIGKILAPRKYTSPGKIVAFQNIVKHELEKMQTRLDVIEKILRPLPYYRGYYRDMGAVRAFQEWIDGLLCFTNTNTMYISPHNQRCKNMYSFKYECCFHRQNEDLSLGVYPSDFNVVRDPKNGRILKCDLWLD